MANIESRTREMEGFTASIIIAERASSSESCLAKQMGRQRFQGSCLDERVCIRGVEQPLSSGGWTTVANGGWQNLVTEQAKKMPYLAALIS